MGLESKLAKALLATSLLSPFSYTLPARAEPPKDEKKQEEPQDPSLLSRIVSGMTGSAVGAITPQKDSHRDLKEHYLRGEWSHVEQVAKKILENEPEDLETRYLLASTLADQKRTSEATSHYEFMIARNDPRGVAGKISMLVFSNKKSEARKLFEGAVQRYKDCAQLFFAKGQLLESENDKSAEDAYKKAIDLDSSDCRWYSQLGLWYTRNNRLDNAIQTLEKGTQLNEFAFGLFNLGSAYAKSGRMDESQRIFARLLEINPSFPRAQEAAKYVKSQVALNTQSR